MSFRVPCLTAGRFLREPLKVMFQGLLQRLKLLRHRDLPPLQIQECRFVQAILSLKFQMGRDAGFLLIAKSAVKRLSSKA